MLGIGLRKSQSSNKGCKLEYFRKKILDHLSKLEEEEKTVNKALDVYDMLKGGYAVGTIRTWKGKKYIKIAPGKWRPKYDGHSRGAKMAISAIKKQILAAKDENEMMQVIIENKGRFTNRRGNPLPFVQELHNYIEEQKTVRGKIRKEDVAKWKKERDDKAVTEAKKRNDEEKARREAESAKQSPQRGIPYTKTTFTAIGEDGNPVKPSESGGDFVKIQIKYEKARAIGGDEDEVQIGKETMTGKWKLVEADTPTASHDETTFNKIPGFPTNADGSSINDRDYEHFEANKEAVLNVASDFDGRALKFDNPVVVTTDGVVISGNNRTMSSKIAARKGTDTKYIETLKKRAKKFGFTEDQVGQFKNPRVVFEVEQSGGYSTDQFAKFNESGKKEMGPTEKAAKVSKMIKMETIEAVAKKIDEFETIGELYRDLSASRHIYTLFKDGGLIGENEAGRYFENGTLTDDGKTFIETALLGTVITETNLRGFNRSGCKSIRATLMRALIPLVENKGMSGYSINKELNEAVDIAMQTAIERDKFKNVDEFARQNNMFESLDPVSVELAKKMEGTQKAFAEFMKGMNGGLKVAANGEVDIFLGKVESKGDILGRFLTIKKAVQEVMRQIPRGDLKKSLMGLKG